VFKRIAEQVLPYLNVPHDIPIAPTTLRAARRAQAVEAADVSDYDPAQFTPIGSGEAASAELRADAPAPEISPADAELLPAQTVELAAGQGISVPDLSGKTVRQVTEICVQLGVNPVLLGEGTVQSQTPEPDTMVRPGSSVVFQFGRPVATPAQPRTPGPSHRAARR
jgi:hypothetical protein